MALSVTYSDLLPAVEQRLVYPDIIPLGYLKELLKLQITITVYFYKVIKWLVHLQKLTTLA